MYRVIVYHNQNDNTGNVMHEPNGYGNKIISGKVDTSFNAINTAEFVISYQNSLYGQIEPIVNLVKVWDTETGKTVFDGRVAKIESNFDGKHTETITCEDCLAYLHDSIQEYMAIDMNKNDISHLFETVISKHNEQVEPHKRFKLGKVDFHYDGGRPVRYIDYKDTFETLKTRFIDMFGGYFTWYRGNDDQLYINYIQTTGDNHESPIRLGVNMKSAKRTLDITGVVTRLFPIGDNIDEPTDEQGTTQDNTNRDPDETHERYTIASENNGLKYIEDEQLKGQFGILGKVEEYQTKDANVLLTYGWNYFHNQRVALLTWDLTVMNYNLLNGDYDPFILGDYYPVDDKLLAGIEYLQIIEKEINVVQPAVITIKIGSKNPNLTDYQQNLQSQVQGVKDAKRNTSSSIDTLTRSIGGASQDATNALEIANEASQDTTNALETANGASQDATNALETANEANTTSANNSASISVQETQISNLNTNMASVQKRLTALEKRHLL